MNAWHSVVDSCPPATSLGQLGTIRPQVPVFQDLEIQVAQRATLTIDPHRQPLSIQDIADNPRVGGGGGGSIVTGKQQIAAGSVFALQKLQRRRLLVPRIRRNGYQIKAAVAVHSEGVLQICELHHPRAAPNGPEAMPCDAEFARSVVCARQSTVASHHAGERCRAARLGSRRIRGCPRFHHFVHHLHEFRLVTRRLHALVAEDGIEPSTLGL
jgi:hypothetical protein